MATPVKIIPTYILLVQHQHDHVFGNGRSNLLAENFLVLFQNLLRHAKVVAPCEESIPYRAIGALPRYYLQQAVCVNHYGIHDRLFFIRCAEVRAAQFLKPFLVKLAVFPERVHLFIDLSCVECSQLLAQLFQAHRGLDVRHQIEYLYLRRGKGNGFHVFCCLELRCKDTTFFRNAVLSF